MATTIRDIKTTARSGRNRNRRGHFESNAQALHGPDSSSRRTGSNVNFGSDAEKIDSELRKTVESN